MKNIAFLFFMIPFVSFSQLIKSNQYDSLLHQRRIVTKPVSVKPDITFKGGINDVSFFTINDKIFIIISGSDKAVGTITENDRAYLITEKDTITIKSIGVQNAYGRSEPDYFNYQYIIHKEDVEQLAKLKLVSINRASSAGFFYQKIIDKFQERLMLLSSALLREMNKTP